MVKRTWAWAVDSDTRAGLYDRRGRMRRMFLYSGRRFKEGHVEKPCRLSIYRVKRGCYWVINDPTGLERFKSRIKVSGPYATLKQAQVNYLIHAETGDWW